MPAPWFRKDKESVHKALGRREPPLMATTMACGPLDELVAQHIELGIFEVSDRLPVARRREGLPDAFFSHTPATLPLLREPTLDPTARLVSRGSAILLRLGWTRGGQPPQSLQSLPDLLSPILCRYRSEQGFCRGLTVEGNPVTRAGPGVRGRGAALVIARAAGGPYRRRSGGWTGRTRQTGAP